MALPASAHRYGRGLSVFCKLVLRAVCALQFALIPTAPSFGQAPGLAQAPPKPALITQPVEESKLTILHGNTYPLARAEYDRGAAPASLPMQRMLLVLKRSPDQEAALEALLDQQQDKASPNYHAWLTPEQFGQQFGPADADIQTITTWLQAQGFQIAHVSNGRTVIEFSGTAAQVQSALHTEIHKYMVDGADHWANASDPQIPTALVPAVAGVLTLHNFPRQAMNNVVGTFKRFKGTSALTPAGPLFTLPNFAQGLTFYGVGPYDFATIYNVSPLWNATPAINGTGQTIAVVGETDVDFVDLEKFRALFGITSNDPIMIVDGPDPGLQPDEIESDLDLEWSSAIAPGATIKFVVAATTDTTLGVDLAAQYIVDHNVAPIVSESYGMCEAALGTAGNQFFFQLWQQAAAQGMSVFLASGDSGSAGCDRGRPAEFGLQVSGFASTPYTTTVGGTDFNDINNFAPYWNPTNDAHLASAKSYIPEMTWNDSCTNSEWSIITGVTIAESNCNNPQVGNRGGIISAGASGGKSGCTVGDAEDITSCSGGYTKPSWQTGAGVPNDNKRDIPDVSLFASDGFNGHFVVICSKNFTGSYCDPNNAEGTIVGIGGTSASAPAFAGIMALIDQKTNSRQGNPNYTLYSLAAQQPAASCNSSLAPASTCVFYDVTLGTIAMPCVTGSTVDCQTNKKSDQFGVLTGYATTTAYDLATGLGTVNAANLVNAWATAAAGSKGSVTSLTMTPSPLTITHGATANLTVTVAPAAGSTGTPSGEVALETSKGIGVGSFLLANGTVTGTTNDLPGGSYTVTAHYPGDATFAASDSTPPIQVTVSPEPSTTSVKVLTADANGNPIPFTSGPYGSFVYVRADVAGQSGNGTATGSVTIKDNGTLIDGNPFPLNSQGNTATPNGVFKFSAGAHSVAASYAGDGSFNPSSSAAVPFMITQAATATTIPGGSRTTGVGTPVFVTAQITATSCGDPPTGKLNFINQGKVVDSEVVAGASIAQCNITLTVTGMFTLNTSGINNITAQYVGDANYSSSTSAPLPLDAVFGTTTAVTPSTPTIQQGSSVTMTATISPSPSQAGGPPITGTVQFSNQSSGVNQGSPVPVTNGQAQITISSLPAGQFGIGATYSGDTNYAGSFGVGAVTVNPGPDFAMVANPSTITVTKPGQPGSTMLMLTAMNGLMGTFNLVPQCTGLPSESSCSVSPASVTFSSTMTSASVMLTVATTAPSNVAPSRRMGPGGAGRELAILVCVLALVLVVCLARKRPRLELVMTVLAFAAFLTMAACGGGGGGGGVHNPGTPIGLDSSAQVSFTLGQATHSIPISINVE
jgi:hypothetical protein